MLEPKRQSNSSGLNRYPLRQPLMSSQRRSSIIQLSNLHPKHLKRSSIKQQLIINNKKLPSAFSQHPFSFASYQKEDFSQYRSNEQAHIFINKHYDILDLSYSLVSSQINIGLLFFLNLIMVIIRYGSLFCLIYITVITQYARWEWLCSIVTTYLIYVVCLMKISLRIPQNQSQTILKIVFDSLQSNQPAQYFQIIKINKLLKSIIRALIPPQWSFIYVTKQSQNRRVQIYSMINYIYLGIEAVVYYPFFLIYTSIYFQETLGEMSQMAYSIIMGSIALAYLLFLGLSLYLLYFGCQKQRLMEQSKKIQ